MKSYTVKENLISSVFIKTDRQRSCDFIVRIMMILYLFKKCNITYYPTNLKLHLEPLVVLSEIIIIVIILTQIQKYYWIQGSKRIRQ